MPAWKPPCALDEEEEDVADRSLVCNREDNRA